jgi:Ca2+-binding RTX toxin-like protein
MWADVLRPQSDMPFSLTGQIPTAPGVAGGARLAAGAATTAAPVDVAPQTDKGVSDVSSGLIAIDPVICPPCFLPDVAQDELRDAAGKLTGYLETVSGPGYSSVTVYDANMNFVSGEYRDSSGYRSSTQRTTLVDATGATTGYRETSSGRSNDYFYDSIMRYDVDFNIVDSLYAESSGYTSTSTRSEIRDSSGKLSGYRLVSSGGGAGYSYSSVDTFDAAYGLVHSEYSDSNGYRSSYSVETQRDNASQVTGYVTAYTWTDGIKTWSSSDRFDAYWNYIDGDSSKPEAVIDGGPKVIPLLTADAGGATTLAARAAETSSSGALDGSAKRGAMLEPTAGDDTFYIDDLRDHVSAASKGKDTVVSDAVSIDLRRGAYKGAQDATLLGRRDLDLHGDGGANTLLGNAGNNRLDGSKSSDTLFGGLGKDVFIIRAGQKGAPDTITDFTHGDDHIELADHALRKLFDASGHLHDGVLGDRLLFDAASGKLSYDRDGAAGKASAKVIVVLVGVDGVGATDFVHG